jgi:hypothetical protein
MDMRTSRQHWTQEWLRVRRGWLRRRKRRRREERSHQQGLRIHSLVSDRTESSVKITLKWMSLTMIKTLIYK